MKCVLCDTKEAVERGYCSDCRQKLTAYEQKYSEQLSQHQKRKETEMIERSGVKVISHPNNTYELKFDHKPNGPTNRALLKYACRWSSLSRSYWLMLPRGMDATPILDEILSAVPENTVPEAPALATYGVREDVAPVPQVEDKPIPAEVLEKRALYCSVYGRAPALFELAAGDLLWDFDDYCTVVKVLKNTVRIMDMVGDKPRVRTVKPDLLSWLSRSDAMRYADRDTDERPN